MAKVTATILMTITDQGLITPHTVESIREGLQEHMLDGLSSNGTCEILELETEVTEEC